MDKGPGERARVRLDAQSAAIGNHARANLRAADCVPVACVQIPATLQLDKGEEKGEQGRFVHTQKRPAEAGPIGKGD